MTLRELEERLRSAGIADAAFEAAIIAERFSGVPRSHYVFSKEEEAGGDAALALARREKGEPLQYIVGEWGFMNETYKVTPAVLIPRQDTEILVGWLIENLPRGGRFADLCTGSGCVAVSTLAFRHDASCVAVEKYPDAVEIARYNAALNGVSDRIGIVRGDVLEGEGLEGVFDVIASNPPYVTEEEYSNLERELYSEPRHALTDGADGLTFYRAITKEYRRYLKPGGAIAFEISPHLADGVGKIAHDAGMTACFIKDLGGRQRVAILTEEKSETVH